jgi:hypothetical protein
MEWKIFVHDRRQDGTSPVGVDNCSANSVDQNTPLASTISWICQEASANNSSFVRLVLLTHGLETPLPSPSESGLSQGGSGLQLCAENLTLDTLNDCQPLNGLLDWIEIHGCGAAYITPGCEGGVGDGNYFCSRLAQITGASVQASTATQISSALTSSNGVMKDSYYPWMGTVYTYGPSGAVTNVQDGATLNTSPPSWAGAPTG